MLLSLLSGYLLSWICIRLHFSFSAPTLCQYDQFSPVHMKPLPPTPGSERKHYQLMSLKLLPPARGLLGPVRVGWWETMNRGKLILCETPGHTAELWTMNNLPPHLKKVPLSKCLCGAMNRRCNCTIKERSHYPSKVGVSWRIHGSVDYLVMWNEISEYSYISQRISIFRDNYKILWLWAAFKKTPTKPEKHKTPWSSSSWEFLGTNTFSHFSTEHFQRR